MMKHLCALAGLLAALSPARGQIAFTDQTSLLNNAALKSGAAIAVVDMNGDGKDDVIRMDNATDLEIDFQQAPGQPFGSFVYGTVTAPGSREWSISVADVDHNGSNDILVGGLYNQVKVLRGFGAGAGFLPFLLPEGVVKIQGTNFVDIDCDGYLDIFLCNDAGENFKYRNVGGNFAGNFNRDDALLDTRAVPSSPPESVDNAGNYSSIWTDCDNDGDLDLYISKCWGSATSPTDPRRINQLFVNDGTNTFTDAAPGAGLADGEQSWCTAFGDIDNDGDLDCFVVNHSGTSALMENDGMGGFANITGTAGFAPGDLAFFGIQAFFEDFDNDTFVDLIVSATGGGTFVTHRLFRNNGNSTFTRVTNPFDSNQIHSCALGDLNGDGFLDVVAAHGTSYNNPSASIPDTLWMNSGNSNHYLAVRLAGTSSNINGIGSRVEVHGSWGVQVRECRSGEGYGVMNSLTEYFGLGAQTAVERVVVRWPAGTIDEVFAPAADQSLLVTEGASPNPLLVWQDGNFDEGEKADPMIGGIYGNADYDKLSNLLEFGLGRDPKFGGGEDGDHDLSGTMTDDGMGNERVVLDFSLPEESRPNLIYEVQVAEDDLAPGAWSTIASKAGLAGWTGPAAVVVGTPAGGRVDITVEDTALYVPGVKRFFRLCVILIAEPAN